MKMKSPLVSVIVPVYNAEKYLSTCLDSICNQTLRDLEIIVVNDGSTDASGKIAEEYMAKDDHIRIIHKRNGNPGATRNLGLEIVKGEYVGFIDGDDWIEKEMYETLLESAIENKSDLVVCGVSVDYTRDKRTIKQQYKAIENNPDKLLDLYFNLTAKNLFSYPVNKLYRTSFIRKYTLRFPEVLPYEDLVFNLKYYMRISSISILPDLFYHYIRREEISAAGAYSTNHLEACGIAEDTFRFFFNVYNYNGIAVEKILRERKIKDYIAYTIGLYKKNSPLTRIERIKLLEQNVFDNHILEQNMVLYNPKGIYERLFYILLNYTTPVMTDYFYQALFYLRYNFDQIYRYFRRYTINR